MRGGEPHARVHRRGRISEHLGGNPELALEEAQDRVVRGADLSPVVGRELHSRGVHLREEQLPLGDNPQELTQLVVAGGRQEPHLLRIEGEDPAHEIAHAAARHWASQMTKMTLMQYAFIPLIFTPMSYPVYVAAAQGLNFGVPLAFLKFNRSAEAEADYLGLQYMYKAGYDPNSYVAFFGKVIQEERREPGSVPKVFMDHPPTPDRIVKSEEEIKEILPKRDQYLVSTSEFDDVKSRMQMVISNRRKQERPGPTLKKRESTDKTTTAQTPSTTDQGKEDDKPPVLKRRD